MFTGIVEEIGTVKQIRKATGSIVLTIQANTVIAGSKEGDSIAVNGVCLTADTFTPNTFTADVMQETLSRSTLGRLLPGSKVNLERAMAADGRFGGHIVSGHIDGTGVIEALKPDGIAVWLKIKTSPAILFNMVEKGSVAIDGVSLTVAQVTSSSFSVSIIPHTARRTILLGKKQGDTVNLENDIIAKYIVKLLGKEGPSSMTKSFLRQQGF